VQPQLRTARYFAVEELAAAALLRMDELGRAVSMYRDLAQHSPATDRLAAFTKAADSASQRQSLQALNSFRRPVVTDNISQPLIVKPKLFSVRAGGQQ
jgi:hypothetical protein